MHKTSILIIISFVAFLSISYGQMNSTTKDTSNFEQKISLLGLKKAEMGDIDQTKPIMLDGVTIPVYNEKGEPISGIELMQLVMSGDYIPEAYIDSAKEVKAFVLRKAAEDEKQQMKKMQSNSGAESKLKGTEAKPFFVKDMDGREYSLENLKGKVIVINFWFVECKPCLMEIPELNKLVEKYKGKDVVFLGFARNEKSKINNFLIKNEFKYNIIPDSKKVIDNYNIISFPTHMIIDKNSVIQYSASGSGSIITTDIDKMIELLLK